MAKLKLTLYNVEYNDSKSGKSVTGEISLYTDKGEATVALTPEAESSATERYNLSMVDFKFQKKMYQPTMPTTSGCSRGTSETSSVRRRKPLVMRMPSDLCVWELMNNPGTGSEMMGGF